MNRKKILPGAAGIIALTATIGFVDNQRELEAGNFSRSKITLMDSMRHVAAESDLAARVPEIKKDHPTYLVEIKHGNKFEKVLIDAVTGQILVS
jgi:hypothetical protein